MELSYQLRKSPFFRILVPYLLGLLVGYHFIHPDMADKMIILAMLFLTLLIFFHISGRVKYKDTWILGVMIMLIFVFTGASNILSRQHILQCQQRMYGNTNKCKLLITERPMNKNGWISVNVIIRQINDEKITAHSEMKAILKLRANAESKKIITGDIIDIKVRFTSFGNPGNPGEFDYQRYMLWHNIPFQLYAVEPHFVNAGHNYGNLKVVAAVCRDYLLDILNSELTDARKKSVLSALTLGYKNELEADTVEIFTRAGVVHIMALSGFNVGLIYILINFLLGFSGNGKPARILRWTVTVVAVWCFAVVTGLTPSVTRAATMLSILITALLINRHTEPLNIIAASAFIILVINPLQFFDVGFQLSYAAVAGIIYFQPFLYKFLIFRNIIADNLWKLFTLSVAAQLATFPLVMFYFHQFPLLFWITNIYAVPIVCVIIYASGLLFLFSFIHPVHLLLSRLLELLTGALIWPLDKLTTCSWVVADGIYISNVQMFILLGLIITAAVNIYFPDKRLLLPSCLVICLFLVLSSMHTFKVKHQRYFTVNKVRNVSVYQLITGTQNRLVAIASTPLSDRTINYHFRNWWIQHKIYRHTNILATENIDASQIENHFHVPCFDTLLGRNIFLNLNGISIVICTDDCFDKNYSSMRFETDYLIITNALKPSINSLLKYFKPDFVIIDSSVTYYRAKMWAEQCRRVNINYHNVNESGAFIVDLNKEKEKKIP